MNKKLFTIFALVVLLGSVAATLPVTLGQGSYLNASLSGPAWVDPPTSFNVTVDIDTDYDLEAWEAVIWYDPGVLTVTNVYFAGYLPAPTSDFWTTMHGAVRLGQSVQTQTYGTGAGDLAYVEFTYITPAPTSITLALLYGITTDLTIQYAANTPLQVTVNTHYPHPEFYWYTEDGINPVPNETISEAGRLIPFNTKVIFNASASYDCDGGSIVQYIWDFGDGNGTVETDPITEHYYADYNMDGYLVNLTVIDDSGLAWSTTYRYGGPAASDTVPMWRDVAVVDIWPSLDWFDSVHYQAPPGTEFQIVVTACNYGSVPETTIIKLYAVKIEAKIDFTTPGPIWKKVKPGDLYLIDTFVYDFDPESGSGFSLITLWTPPEPGLYLLFATIELSGNPFADQNWDNNYVQCPTVVDTLTDPATFAAYVVDLDGDGSVGTRDLYIFGQMYGKGWP